MKTVDCFSFFNYHKILFLLLLVLHIFFFCDINSQDTTYVQGTIAHDSVWTKEGNPYIVTGNISVFPNVTFSILEGVVVKFDGNFKIGSMGGKINFLGSVNDSILITSNKEVPQVGDWSGIEYGNEASGNVEFTVIEYSDKAFNFLKGSAIISDSKIRYNNYGASILEREASPQFLRCRISNNDYGIFSDEAGWDNGRVIISQCNISFNNIGVFSANSTYWNMTKCIIRDNLNYGVKSQGGQTDSCLIYHNDIGLEVGWESATVSQYNTIVENRLGITVVDYPKRPTVKFNNIYDNYEYDAYYIGGADDGGLDFTENYWGTTNADSISLNLYDYLDNPNLLGWFNYQPFLSDPSIITDVKSENIIPDNYSLSQNYPNPFNPTTTINYSIANSGIVHLNIYNLLGEEVKSLVDKYQSTGSYAIDFNASNLPSGIYFYRLQSGNFSETKKLILMK